MKKNNSIPALLPCLCPKSQHHRPTLRSQLQLQHITMSVNIHKLLNIPARGLISEHTEISKLTSKMFHGDASKNKGSTGSINCTWKKLGTVKGYS